MNVTDTKYADFIGAIIDSYLTDALSRIPIMNDEALKDIILAECMDRVPYEELKLEVQTLCTEIIDKETIKLVNLLNNGKGM